MTTRREQRPSRFCAAISRMASIDSCFAESMKAQVLTTSTSAFDGVGRDFVAGLARHAQHHLAIDEVLGTAEAEESDLHWCWAQGFRARVLGISIARMELSRLEPDPGSLSEPDHHG